MVPGTFNRGDLLLLLYVYFLGDVGLIPYLEQFPVRDAVKCTRSH